MDDSIFNKIKGPPLNSLKGLLIISILISHDKLIIQDFQNLKTFFYFFHVQTFLVLGVVFNKVSFNFNFMRDKAVRYLVPFFSILFFYTLIYNFIFNLENKKYFSILINMVKSIVFGNFNTVKESSGFYSLWFLPCLFTIILLHSLFLRKNLIINSILAISCIITYLYIGDLNPVFNIYGIYTALYFLPISILIKTLLMNLKFKLSNFFILFTILIFCLTFYDRSFNTLSPGSPNLYSINQRYQFVWYFITFPLWTIFLSSLSKIYHNRFFNALGKNSLIIYLIHQPVQMVIINIIKVSNLNIKPYGGLLSVLFSILISYLISKKILEFNSLRLIFFPLRYDEWISELKNLIKVN